jgi:hypothetical protein
MVAVADSAFIGLLVDNICTLSRREVATFSTVFVVDAILTHLRSDEACLQVLGLNLVIHQDSRQRSHSSAV